MPVNAARALPRFEEMERRICELAAAGNYDDEIARTLTNEGHRSPGCTTGVLPTTVRSIRLRRGIKMAKTRGRWRPVENYITLSEIVDRLGIPRKWFQTHLNRGTLVTRKEPSGRYLFPDTAEALASIRKLRSHCVMTVDLVGASA